MRSRSGPPSARAPETAQTTRTQFDMAHAQAAQLEFQKRSGPRGPVTSV
jgi:hypothetical protein